MNTQSFKYLQQPHQLYENIPKISDFSNQQSQHNKKRVVFYNQPYSQYENQQIRLFKIFAHKERIHIESQSITNQCICRFLYSEKFSFRNTSKKLEQYIEWMHNPSIQTLTETTKQIMNSGAMYTFGRDRKMRPVIYVQLGLINLRNRVIDNYFTVFNAIVNVVTQYLFIKGYIEQYTVVIEASNAKFIDLPLDKMIESVQKLMSVYPMYLGKMLIINSGNYINLCSTTIKNILNEETKSKIIIIENKKVHEILQHIDPTNLQKKYGGQNPNLIFYWPPTLPRYLQSTQKGTGQDSFSEQYFSVNENNPNFMRSLNEVVEIQSEQLCCQKQICCIF